MHNNDAVPAPRECPVRTSLCPG
eukprot:Gb_08192 [translate_table: standard]